MTGNRRVDFRAAGRRGERRRDAHCRGHCAGNRHRQKLGEFHKKPPDISDSVTFAVQGQQIARIVRISLCLPCEAITKRVAGRDLASS